MEVETSKWNPLTFAVYNANFPLIRHIVESCLGNAKKLLKVPGLYNT